MLSKGMVVFHLKLKAPWKCINTNKNIKVLRVYLNCTRTVKSALNVTRTVAKRKLEKNSVMFKPEFFRLLEGLLEVCIN